jgi:hypothetical protein
LWTDFDCEDLDVDKTRVYLERSKSSPISVRIDEGSDDLSPHNSFFQIVPHAVDRLKSLVVNGTPRNLSAITAPLSRPAPLLEYLWIDGNCESMPQDNPTLTSALFNRDLPSLRELHLEYVRTELPWRNMVNLTSFELWHTTPDDFSIRQLLDFFESAPRLRTIDLLHATPTSGAQHGRLVSLDCLKSMAVIGDETPSLLLDHLIIPVGAKLSTQGGPLNEGLLPRSLDNLKNLSGFTDINLHIDGSDPYIRFSGPNGQVRMYIHPNDDTTRLMLESLARFDTSKTERLQIDYGHSHSRDPPYQALHPMDHLRTLILYRCTSPDIFIHALDPNTNSSGVAVCPELEELILVLRLSEETLDIKNVKEMAAARASRGAKLKSIKISSHDKSMQIDALDLREHALHVECGPEVNVVNKN